VDKEKKRDKQRGNFTKWIELSSCMYQVPGAKRLRCRFHKLGRGKGGGGILEAVTYPFIGKKGLSWTGCGK